MNNKNLRQWNLHISTHADQRPHAVRFQERHISSVAFMSVHLYGNVYMQHAWHVHSPIRPILGYWGSKVHKNGRFPALDANVPPCKMTWLALSSAEKSVTVQSYKKHTNKQQPIYPHLAYRHV